MVLSSALAVSPTDEFAEAACACAAEAGCVAVEAGVCVEPLADCVPMTCSIELSKLPNKLCVLPVGASLSLVESVASVADSKPFLWPWP